MSPGCGREPTANGAGNGCPRRPNGESARHRWKAVPWGNSDEVIQKAGALTDGKASTNGAEPVSMPWPPVPHGVSGMVGLVSEWVKDWYAEDFYRTSPARDPQGPCVEPFECCEAVAGWNGRSNCAPVIEDGMKMTTGVRRWGFVARMTRRSCEVTDTPLMSVRERWFSPASFLLSDLQYDSPSAYAVASGESAR